MNYIIYDLEATCGWIGEDRQSEIIEIGAVKLNEKLEVIDEFQSFVRPILNPELTPFCTKLTTIQQSDVDNADTFDIVFHDFVEWCCTEENGNVMGTKIVQLCSWGHYDKNQLIQDCRLWNVSAENWIANQHISIKHQHGTMIGQKRGIGMERALAMYGLTLDGTHHRGIDDARNAVKIFTHIFPNLIFDSNHGSRRG